MMPVSGCRCRAASASSSSRRGPRAANGHKGRNVVSPRPSRRGRKRPITPPRRVSRLSESRARSGTGRHAISPALVSPPVGYLLEAFLAGGARHALVHVGVPCSRPVIAAARLSSGGADRLAGPPRSPSFPGIRGWPVRAAPSRLALSSRAEDGGNIIKAFDVGLSSTGRWFALWLSPANAAFRFSWSWSLSALISLSTSKSAERRVRSRTRPPVAVHRSLYGGWTD